MKEPLTPKEAMLSALYVILLFIFATLLYFIMFWFTNNILFELLNWFNRKTTFMKIVLFVSAGGFILALAIILFQIIGGLLSAYIFGKLPLNWFTGIFAAVVYLLNIIIGIRSMWQAVPTWSFWYVTLTSKRSKI